ncbi:conserved membrane hypothetical protein [Gammaproteobacteria bacterium]
MSPSTPTARRLFARGSTLLGGSGAALGASFLQTILIARGLGPESFGVWAGIQAFCTVVATLVTFRTSEPVTRYLVEYRTRNQTALPTTPSDLPSSACGDPRRVELLLGTAITVDAVTQILAIIAIILSAPWVAPILSGGEGAVVFYPLVGIGLLRSVFDHTWFSVARDLGRYRTIATLNALFPALRLAVTAALWLADALTLATLAMLMMVTGIVQMLITGRYLQRAINSGYGIGITALFPSDLLQRQHQLSSFWSFMKATFLWSLFTALVKEGDILILGGLRPAEEVGWYRLAKNLISIAQQVADLLSQVIYQDFSEQVVACDGVALRRTIRFLAKTWLPVIVVMTLVSIGLAHWVIPFIFGSVYQPTAEIFSILLIGSGVVTMLFWVRPLALALELHWYNFQVVAWGTILFLGLDWVLIHAWGVLGAATAFSLLTVAGPIALLPPVWRKLNRMHTELP